MDKIKLFEITFKKISADRSYIAYYMHRLMVEEGKTQIEMMALLNCSADNYYKLALCQVPEIGSENFVVGIEKIAAYSNISNNIILNILDHTFSKSISKIPKRLTLFEESLDVFKKTFSAPKWIYQPIITLVILLLMIMPGFSRNHETKILKAYIGDFNQYVDSMKYAQYQDNTFVLRKNL